MQGRRKGTAIALILILLLLSFSACTPETSTSSQLNASSASNTSSAVPTSSEKPTLSSQAQTSSVHASSETASSEPYIPLDLKQNPDQMLKTICSVAYVDKNGVLHYNPAYLPDKQVPFDEAYASVIDTSVVPDGTKGVRGVYITAGSELLYVLMENGTVKSVPLLAGSISGADRVESELKAWENVRWIYPYTTPNDSFFDVTTPWGFATNEQGKIKRVYAKFEPWEVSGAEEFCKILPAENATTIQYANYHHFCLYADGTVLGTSLQEAITADWKNIVQLGRHNEFIIGLQRDGTLVHATHNQANESSFHIPEKYCKNVQKILSGNYLQLTDGTLYCMEASTGVEEKEIGVFPELDQIFKGKDFVVYGVDSTGKVICLVKEIFGPADEWLLSITDAKTISPNES